MRALLPHPVAIKRYATDDAQNLSRHLVDAALPAGRHDNVTALVVRVLGLVDANLQDENRKSPALSMPTHLKIGDARDGVSAEGFARPVHCVLVALVDGRPVDMVHECINVSAVRRAVVSGMRVLVHVQRQEARPGRKAKLGRPHP